MHNLKQYSNPNGERPSWNPKVVNESAMFPVSNASITTAGNHVFPVYVADQVFTGEFCKNLINEFEAQDKYPVGIDGYCNSINNAGSFRAMAWAEEFANVMTETFDGFMIEKELNFDSESKVLKSRRGHEFRTSLEHEHTHYKMLGSTPWMRFMSYSNGGMHVPHYDAPFVNEAQRYVTLFSWVLYLNTPNGIGGEFQFVRDARNDHTNDPFYWDRSDWRNMSDEVILSVAPTQGRLLVFPHWLCHQVQKYIGEGHRYIVRGDLAYGY